ncbi:hypothetical protein [Thalassotalea litorea]|uniref:hypothetical protein n=1 Tax=Thalassotalea litorea TaxID=2020715 RepID=UPI0037360580
MESTRKSLTLTYEIATVTVQQTFDIHSLGSAHAIRVGILGDKFRQELKRHKPAANGVVRLTLTDESLVIEANNHRTRLSVETDQPLPPKPLYDDETLTRVTLPAYTLKDLLNATTAGVIENDTYGFIEISLTEHGATVTRFNHTTKLSFFIVPRPLPIDAPLTLRTTVKDVKALLRVFPNSPKDMVLCIQQHAFLLQQGNRFCARLAMPNITPERCPHRATKVHVTVLLNTRYFAKSLKAFIPPTAKNLQQAQCLVRFEPQQCIFQIGEANNANHSQERLFVTSHDGAKSLTISFRIGEAIQKWLGTIYHDRKRYPNVTLAVETLESGKPVFSAYVGNNHMVFETECDLRADDAIGTPPPQEKLGQQDWQHCPSSDTRTRGPHLFDVWQPSSDRKKGDKHQNSKSEVQRSFVFFDDDNDEYLPARNPPSAPEPLNTEDPTPFKSDDAKPNASIDDNGKDDSCEHDNCGDDDNHPPMRRVRRFNY